MISTCIVFPLKQRIHYYVLKPLIIQFPQFPLNYCWICAGIEFVYRAQVLLFSRVYFTERKIEYKPESMIQMNEPQDFTLAQLCPEWQNFSTAVSWMTKF